MTNFGVMTWAEPRESIQHVAEIAKAAEIYGFNTLWLWDTPLYTKDAYIALTVAALNTKKILLAPGVSNPLTRHLSITANAIATLDDLSDGRAVLGFGNGAPGSTNALGYPTPHLNQFRESLQRLGALMRGEEVVIDDKTRYSILSVQRPIPIYVAAGGPRMLKVCGELTNGALIAVPAQRELIARQIQHVYEGAKAVGRNQREVAVNVMLMVSIHPDPQVAINHLKPDTSYVVIRNPVRWGESEELPEYAEIVGRIKRQHDYRTAPSSRGPLAELVPDSLVKYVAIAGTQEECRERLAETLTLQPDEVTFVLNGGDKMQQLENLAAIIP